MPPRDWPAQTAHERPRPLWHLPECQTVQSVLKTVCQTRWGSRQAMSERILEQQKAIAQVISNERKLRHLTLSRQDVDVLEADNKSLSPLVEFTDALSGEKYVSVLWQPSPKPSGQVARGVDGVYRRYPPAGDRERPLRRQLRQRARKIRYPLKDCLMFSQGREPGVRAEQSISRTRNPIRTVR